MIKCSFRRRLRKAGANVSLTSGAAEKVMVVLPQKRCVDKAEKDGMTMGAGELAGANADRAKRQNAPSMMMHCRKRAATKSTFGEATLFHGPVSPRDFASAK